MIVTRRIEIVCGLDDDGQELIAAVAHDPSDEDVTVPLNLILGDLRLAEDSFIKLYSGCGCEH